MSTSKYDEKHLIATLKERGVAPSDLKAAVQSFITLLPKGTLHHDAFNTALEVGVFSETNLVKALGQDQKLADKKFEKRRNAAIEHFKKLRKDNVPARQATNEAINVAYKGLTAKDVPTRVQHTKNAAGLTPTSRLDSFVETTKGVVQSAKTKLPERKPREPKPARQPAPRTDRNGRTKENLHPSQDPRWFALWIGIAIALVGLILLSSWQLIEWVAESTAEVPVIQQMLVMIPLAILVLVLVIWAVYRLVRFALGLNKALGIIVMVLGFIAILAFIVWFIPRFIQLASWVGGPGTGTIMFLEFAVVLFIVFIGLAVLFGKRFRNHWTPYYPLTADRPVDEANEEILATNTANPATT